MDRRQFLVYGSASLGLLTGCASSSMQIAKAKVVVVGGGYGGATAAKYVRMFSNYSAQVTLIEPDAEFISCPLSNLVIGGFTSMSSISMPYDNLSKRHGVNVIRDKVVSIDARKKSLKLASGNSLTYDKLILSPGTSMMMDKIEGLQQANDAGVTTQAWKAGNETILLRKQLESMKDGGVFAISIPEAPYRCPPGPYERACQVANYFKLHKPKSKVLILDANGDVTSKGPLFKKAWSTLYSGMIEYRPNHNVVEVDFNNKILKFEVQDDVKADVLNVLPMMRAGEIAVQTGVANANGRWALVNYLNFESTVIKDIHVLGDSIQVAPLMPKSGHMANSQAKVAAAAIVSELSGLEMNQSPMLTNTCYSFVSSDEVVHIASVHQYVASEKTFRTVPGSGGLSLAPSKLEGVYAWGWARNIWADMLT